MTEILAVPAFARALAALAAAGIAFPAVGTVILCLELVPARFAVMHAALLGAAVGIALGADPSASALAAAAASGLLVARLSERSSASAGGPLGLVMTLTLALAFIVFYKADVNAIEAFNLFWGNALALTRAEAVMAVCASAVVLSAFALFHRPIKAVLYDRELAAASGLPARAVFYALVTGTCIAVGVAMRLNGALMADASTILPALAARRLKLSLGGTLAAGAAFGLLANLGGFALALAFDLPISPAVIVAAAACIGVSAALRGGLDALASRIDCR